MARAALAVLCLAALALSAAAECAGTWKDDKCRCPAGKGGPKCDFSMETVFGGHAPSVYKLGRVRPLDLQGWNPLGDLYKRLLEQVKPNLVIEVGVWKGASTAIMGQWLKDAGHGVMLAVDTWLGSLEFWQYPGPTVDLMWRHGFPSVYYTFTSNMIHKGLTEQVIPFPVPSRLAADFLVDKNITSELVFVDGAHYYEDVVEDIKLWWPIVAPGGIMLGDDYTEVWPGVKRAANEHAERVGVKVHTEGDKWWVVKPKN